MFAPFAASHDFRNPAMFLQAEFIARTSGMTFILLHVCFLETQVPGQQRTLHSCCGNTPKGRICREAVGRSRVERTTHLAVNL